MTTFATTIAPKATSLLLTGNADHDRIDFGAPVAFVQITNRQLSNGMFWVCMNDDPEAKFMMYDGETQSFSRGDLSITSLSFQIISSGAGNEVVEVIWGELV